MKISIQELKEGAILAADVMSANGQLLLKSGSPVTEKHIRAFKTWGVKEVELPGRINPRRVFLLKFSLKQINIFRIDSMGLICRIRF